MTRIDEISHTLGVIAAGIEELRARAAEDRSRRDAEHERNLQAIAALTERRDREAAATSEALAALTADAGSRATSFKEYMTRTDKRIEALELMQPVVDGLKLTKQKLTALASIGFVVMIAAGWVVEAAIKYAVQWVLDHLR